ncbi:MAG TPA: ribbon-helix-helix protein, CopG family [Acidobacteria bacterium]|nr:ribbon-helix-helix protein, CopG family [Acidobacteriota bacterium]
MAQVTARIPDELVQRLEESARTLRRSRAEVIRQAIEYYLDDVEDLRAALEVLQDPADPVLDWSEVRRDLLGQDQG